jgi:hypothetical protein
LGSMTLHLQPFLERLIARKPKFIEAQKKWEQVVKKPIEEIFAEKQTGMPPPIVNMIFEYI